MKILLLFSVLLFGISAQAMNFEQIEINKNKVQIWAEKGGIIVPATETVGDLIGSLSIGSHDCSAKFMKSSHKGVHTYTILEIDSCT